MGQEMKAWYDDIDAATLQRIKTYSAFNDAESKNLMIQTMYEYREKEIAELEKENAELKAIVGFQTSSNIDRHFQLKRSNVKLIKAKELILKLYNAGRDVLMCRTEEKAYDNLSEAINDRSIEQFLKEVSE